MESHVEATRRALAARPEIEFAILFGSGASGQLRPSSDIDLAVRFAPGGRPVGWDHGGLIAALESSIGRRVDLVDLERTTSAVLRMEIAKGLLVKGTADELVRVRVRAFRDWRDVGPMFRRCARAQGVKLAQGMTKEVKP